MATKKPTPASHTSAADTTQAVDEFMRRLDHPFKAGIQAIRTTLLAVDPAIAEGVKWNAPSFRTTDYFATTHLRQKAGAGVVLHLGTKARDLGAEGVPIDDPDHLLKWLAKDRAIIVFQDMSSVMAGKAAFERIIRQWITHV